MACMWRRLPAFALCTLLGTLSSGCSYGTGRTTPKVSWRQAAAAATLPWDMT